MKIALCWFIVLKSFVCLAQNNYSISSQKDRLRQYSGQWISAAYPSRDSVALFPEIKMSSITNFNNHSLTVKVSQKDANNQYHPILHEIIGYDSVTDTIFAAGHNAKGAFFTGKGKFSSENNWTMQDKDLNGNKTIKVDFNFQNYTDVILEGFDNNKQSLWKTRYIKNNPSDKNIGIQLVSVHDEMLKNPEQTLIQLGRMGYSYVETFVYKNGGFYGQSPTQFKAMVEKAGMKFLGSMTFFDPENKNDDAAINTWWTKTIQDHKKAGVEYLSTSNSKIKNIKTIKDLQEYCNYYNKVGKLCKNNGLKFIFHNHADEFLMVEEVRVYDYFLKNTNPEYVYFQSDIYWMQVAGVNPVDYFKAYPNRFISWHVKDFKELGESGKIDFKHIFKYQELSGVQYIISEVEDYSFPPLFSVSLAWEYIYYELLR
ncbi:sugar phosphate isomerase/epimerase family protein [Gelidibacter salicanalis]|uniref:Sugar phosphate isomerase/epimerase n=1 Tax=Gelidibacter salicanalis TaxID=291193 RepID=A0A934KKC0_9FLAO|nr:sugar phosphate isomerase/epimerase [Gelidibacter salicanalis]MBJ7880657.1 sugar phosphate isomerase/epimerase [Gelidibacter salicanalis]